MTSQAQIVAPRLGEGIYTVKDISNILKLDYELVRRWVAGYWDEHFHSVFGERKNKAINFYSLIEFYTFYKLRESGISAQELRKAHSIISEELGTPYPFATADAFSFERRKYRNYVWYGLEGNLVKANGKHQISLAFVQPFLDRIEYDKNQLAERFFPLEQSRNIVVDPKHQFGQPTILGTNIKTQTIYHLHLGGETDEDICTLYHLSIDKVQDAISFHHKKAA